ncbi:hypothetical protein [Asanoa siamensis]|uniref:Uncharacterized protein n=1 Tax=Asanoa siamensis TaxID=926357 RepID=A0ABQ4D533_9ACTN|nr:hypothetical protein [Asanoa siamensis]GIF78644.1 hypothetical protein Asi02nite_81620 [Asanoa siamensis]
MLRRLSRRSVIGALLALPALAWAVPAAAAPARRPECVADLIVADPSLARGA